MYFVFSLIALFSWAGSDLFTKLGTSQNDKFSQWRVIFFVGVIMGFHALITLIVSPFLTAEKLSPFICSIIYTDFKFIDFIRYLPIAFIYLSAMVIGYVGLRYIELSVSSPICNSSGSLALLICIILGFASLNIPSGLGVVFITVGIIFLGIVEYRENDEVKLIRQNQSDFKYKKSFIAILIPILYLIIDALGTVGDQLVSNLNLFDMSEYASNTAFELTSLLFAVFALLFVKLIKKEKFFNFAENKNKRSLILGGTCETIGQMFYMAVMFSDFSAGMPMISAYCVISVLLSRIFLKEKLSFKHYIAIAITILGIIILGIFSEV